MVCEYEGREGHPGSVKKGVSPIVVIYTDGATIGRNPSQVGGAWAWCGCDVFGKRVVENSGIVLRTRKYPELSHYVSNNHMEFYAVGNALSYLPDGWSGKVITDSMVNISRFRNAGQRKLPKNTPYHWVHWFWKHLSRLGKVEAIWVKGHSIHKHNNWCDAECLRVIEAWQKERGKSRTLCSPVEEVMSLDMQFQQILPLEERGGASYGRRECEWEYTYG